MSKKKPIEEPEARPEPKPEKPKEPTQDEVRKVIAGNMGFAASLANTYRACKEAGMTNPDTDNKMKGIIDGMVRNTFGIEPQPVYQHTAPVAAPQAPPQQPYQPPMQQPQQTTVPQRVYPGQKPGQ